MTVTPTDEHIKTGARIARMSGGKITIARAIALALAEAEARGKDELEAWQRGSAEQDAEITDLKNEVAELEAECERLRMQVKIAADPDLPTEAGRP